MDPYYLLYFQKSINTNQHNSSMQQSNTIVEINEIFLSSEDVTVDIRKISDIERYQQFKLELWRDNKCEQTIDIVRLNRYAEQQYLMALYFDPEGFRLNPQKLFARSKNIKLQLKLKRKKKDNIVEQIDDYTFQLSFHKIFYAKENLGRVKIEIIGRNFSILNCLIIWSFTLASNDEFNSNMNDLVSQYFGNSKKIRVRIPSELLNIKDFSKLNQQQSSLSLDDNQDLMTLTMTKKFTKISDMNLQHSQLNPLNQSKVNSFDKIDQSHIQSQIKKQVCKYSYWFILIIELIFVLLLLYPSKKF